MNRIRTGTVILLAVTVIILAGELVVYGVDTRNYSSEAAWSSDGVDVDIHSSLYDTYSIVLAENSLKLENLFIYIDPDYGKNLDTARQYSYILELDPEHDADQLKKNLAIRNFNNVRTCNPTDIEEILNTHDPSKTGIVSFGYALPLNVYDGTSSSKILNWISSGGTLYWVGSQIGTLYYDGDDIVPVNGSSLFIGDAVQNVGELKADREIANPYSLYNTNMVLGASTGTGSRVLQTGWGDGTYSTVTFFGVGTGNVCIVSGTMFMSVSNDLAQIITSGLCADTNIIECREGSFKGHETVTIKAPITSNTSVYVYFGGTMTTYGAGYNA